MTNSQQLDRTLPAFADFTPGAGARLQQLGARYNLVAVFTALPKLLAQLDGDANVTDVNYVTLCTPTGVANTIAAFNTLLAKLDADTLVVRTTYLSRWRASSGDDLAFGWEGMVADLNANGADTTYVAKHGGITATTLDCAGACAV